MKNLKSPIKKIFNHFLIVISIVSFLFSAHAYAIGHGVGHSHSSHSHTDHTSHSEAHQTSHPTSHGDSHGSHPSTHNNPSPQPVHVSQPTNPPPQILTSQHLNTAKPLQPTFNHVANQNRTVHPDVTNLQLKPLIVQPVKAVNSNNVNKNSNAYKGDVYVYAIRNDTLGRFEKVGETATGFKQDGTLKRAATQMNRFEKETGHKYSQKILNGGKPFESKEVARKGYETPVIKRHRSIYGQDTLPNNKGVR